MNLKEYLQQDRQWKREHRIAHARYMLKRSTSKQDRQFWEDVLRANIEAY